MLINPRLIPMVEDETLWLYTATLQDIEPLLSDTGSWISTNIGPSVVSASGNYFIEFSTNSGTPKGIVFTGIAETSMVLISGFDPAGSVPSKQYWNNLDALILSKDANAAIEFFVIRDINRVFIHLELAPDKLFLAEFMAQISKGQKEFVSWLQTESVGGIPRTLKFIEEDGQETLAPVSSIELFAKGVITSTSIEPARMYYENLAPGAPSSTLKACGGFQANIIDSEADPITVELENVIIKAYAVEENP